MCWPLTAVFLCKRDLEEIVNTPANEKEKRNKMKGEYTTNPRDHIARLEEKGIVSFRSGRLCTKRNNGHCNA